MRSENSVVGKKGFLTFLVRFLFGYYCLPSRNNSIFGKETTVILMFVPVIAKVYDLKY